MPARPTEEIAAYSLFPYSSTHKDDPRHLLERMRKYVLAFKYGRGDDGTGRNFVEIVDDLAAQGWASPAFDNARVLVPVPPLDPPRARRGEPPFEPCWELTQALARRLPDARAVRLFERTRSVGWVEGQAPPTLADHVQSLARTREAVPAFDQPIALIADLVTRGTELLGCALALRSAGYSGPLTALVVAQATGKYPQPLQLRSFLASRISGPPDQPYPTREDLDVWFDPDARLAPDPH